MRDDLMKYYLGTIDDDARLQIENELLTSPASLTLFIAIKRTCELPIDQNAAPSTSIALRLRCHLNKNKRHFKWKSFAATAALLALGLSILFWRERFSSNNSSLLTPDISAAIVDSSNQTSMTSNVY